MNNTNNLNKISCPVCGGDSFSHHDVLWPELVSAWQLSSSEVGYVNRQQGTHCDSCGNNIRSMALASAIVYVFGENHSTLTEFIKIIERMDVLEINRAANLTPFLGKIKGHRLIEYPEYDLQELEIDTGTFDLVVHSDTLEHVQNPLRSLNECRRVLRPGGVCIFTVPIIVDRFSRRRDGLPLSYHGNAERSDFDQVVYSEFGADFWKLVIQAGFRDCAFYSFEYPAGLAIIARV